MEFCARSYGTQSITRIYYNVFDIMFLYMYFCFGNFMDVLFTSRDMGYFGKLIMGIFSSLHKGNGILSCLLPGILDTCSPLYKPHYSLI